MTSLRFEQWVAFPLEQVFAFFANPRNLPRIMPPNTDTEILELRLIPPSLGLNENLDLNKHFAGPGSEIVISFRPVPFLPFRQQWIALITEFECNHHFADIQKKGPFKSWHHRHEFSGETRNAVQGTTVRDHIEYEVGFGFAGEIANRLFVRRTFNQMFAHRQSNLEKGLE